MIELDKVSPAVYHKWIRQCLKPLPCQEADQNDERSCYRPEILRWRESTEPLLLSGFVQTGRVQISSINLNNANLPIVAEYCLASPVTALEWINRSNVAVAGISCTIVDAESGMKPVREFTNGKTQLDLFETISSIGRFQNDHNLFAVGTRSGRIRLFDVRKRKEQSVIQTSELIVRKSNDSIQSLTTFAEDKMIVASHADGLIRVWDNRFMLTALKTMLVQDHLPLRDAAVVDSAIKITDRCLILQLNPSRLVLVDLYRQRISRFSFKDCITSSFRQYPTLLSGSSIVYADGTKLFLRGIDLRKGAWNSVSVDGSLVVSLSGHPHHPLMAVTTESSSQVRLLTPMSHKHCI